MVAALTKSSSISLRSLRPASTPSFVISVNITREILDLSISLAIWAAIASPSLSESVAIITSGAVFDIFLGDWAPEGVMDPNIYLALVTIHGTIMVFFVLTAGLSGTFSNLLIPLQIGARDMASGLLNMISFWLFFLSSMIMLASLFVEAGPAAAAFGSAAVWPVSI